MRTSQKVVILSSSGLNWLNQGTWTIGPTTATNTPSLGAELLSNGDFANWTDDDPDDWAITGESSDDPEVSEVGSGQTHGGGGSGAANFFSSATANTPRISQFAGATVGSWYMNRVEISASVSGSLRVEAGHTNSIVFSSVSSHFISLLQSGNGNSILRVIGSTSNITVDTFSIKSLTLAELITVAELGTSNIVAAAKIDSLSAGTQAGMSISVDNHDNPQNMVIAYHNGSQVVLEKRVSGTWTTVSTTTVPFSASAELRVEKSGSAFSTYYNGGLVKSDTVSDVSIVGNTNHGLFSTHSANTFSDFSFTPN